LVKRPKNTLEQASTHDLLGCIQLANRDAEAASNSLEEALRIRLRCLKDSNPYHPDIGVSYQNLAKLKMRFGAFEEAKSLCENALVIYRHNYHQSHTRVKEVVKCLEEIRRNL
jgi:tetratricopeptide (TPR) repeat protein